ncbi:hypothetical protein AGR5A_Lc20175 [Agrobacterium genomosp. 5 str. CFBP 6626]|nr:hypothetical protein AGR5A_Lc20175 [Agrobacterium genomosp. 5 str. CFBP 6626]
MPGNGCTPVMADDHCFVFTKGIHESDEVTNAMKDRVLIRLFRSLRFAIAAHVRRNGAKTGVSQRCHLMPPRMLGFWKSMAEQHQGTSALIKDAHVDRSCLDDCLDHFPNPGIFPSFHRRPWVGMSEGPMRRRKTG